ncbi:MAG: hypothetical protein QOG15_2047 [Solirubrobacteraceae bacterium]|jgi:uncharacterized protein (TIGR02453 family)|nr:hypothetical protein [Solirubrobacteraceae bacterium]
MPSSQLIDDVTDRAFPKATTKFLRTLRDNNDRAWFDAHRDEYHAAYVEPAKAFVSAVAPALERIAPGIHAEPRILASIFRINRDTRFTKDKRPYKDHLDLWFWEGERKTAVSGFFLRISPALVGIGAGSHGFDRDALMRFRAAAADPDRGDELLAVADDLERQGFEIGGERYARVPRDVDVDADDPAARFLRHGALNVHHEEPAKLASDAERLMATCVDIWSRLAPLHRWLVQHVQ